MTQRGRVVISERRIEGELTTCVLVSHTADVIDPAVCMFFLIICSKMT